MKQPRPAAWFRVALCSWMMAVFLPACFRLGYGSRQSSADAGRWMDAGMSSVDAGILMDAGRSDAGLSDGGLSMDAQMPGGDGALESGMPREDAGSAADTGTPGCGSVNACGGCETLSAALGASCGGCQLGHYVCDGTDALLCEGGDARPVARAGALTVDDLEDGDRFVRADSGLSGDWHTLADTSGGTLTPPVGSPVVPVAGGASGSDFSVRVQGRNFTDWGAGLAVSLDAYECAVDASAHTEFSFAVRGSSTSPLLVSVATLATTETSAGGSCTTGACNDHFNLTVPLTNSWTTHHVSFDDLEQTGWGTAVPTFAADEILYIQFSFGPGTTFDISVDDLAFD